MGSAAATSSRALTQTPDPNPNQDLSADELASVHRLAVELESGAAADQDTNDSPLLPGRWRVLYQGKPGTTTSFFSVESWRSYLSGDGPSNPDPNPNP